MFTLTGCKKEEVQEEIIQGEVAIDKNYLTSLLMEHINEDLTSTTNFSVSFYSDKLSEENLQFITAYSARSGFAYYYSPKLNADVYQRSMGTYWYDKGEKLWYHDNSVIREGTANSLTNFVRKLDLLKYRVELGEEEVFNSTNCYVLLVTTDKTNETPIAELEKYTKYYITKDTYTLLGTMQQISKIESPLYSLISYDAMIELPEAAKQAEKKEYNDFVISKADDNFYKLYTLIFGEKASITIENDIPDEYKPEEPEPTPPKVTQTTSKFID